MELILNVFMALLNSSARMMLARWHECTNLASTFFDDKQLFEVVAFVIDFVKFLLFYPFGNVVIYVVHGLVFTLLSIDVIFHVLIVLHLIPLILILFINILTLKALFLIELLLHLFVMVVLIDIFLKVLVLLHIKRINLLLSLLFSLVLWNTFKLLILLLIFMLLLVLLHWQLLQGIFIVFFLLLNYCRNLIFLILDGRDSLYRCRGLSLCWGDDERLTSCTMGAG